MFSWAAAGLPALAGRRGWKVFRDSGRRALRAGLVPFEALLRCPATAGNCRLGARPAAPARRAVPCPTAAAPGTVLCGKYCSSKAVATTAVARPIPHPQKLPVLMPALAPARMPAPVPVLMCSCRSRMRRGPPRRSRLSCLPGWRLAQRRRRRRPRRAGQVRAHGRAGRPAGEWRRGAQAGWEQGCAHRVPFPSLKEYAVPLFFSSGLCRQGRAGGRAGGREREGGAGAWHARLLA